MKRIIYISCALTPWADSRVKDRGSRVQVADDKPERFRLVDVLEEDPVNFKRWSYWVDKADIVYHEE